VTGFPVLSIITPANRMIAVSSTSTSPMPSRPSRYEIPTDGTSGIDSPNWKPAVVRS